MDPFDRQMDGETNPSWELIQSSLISLPSKGPDHGFSLEIGDESWIIVYHVPTYGFLVTICAVGEKDYYALVNSSLGNECIRVWCAGEYMERLRLVFVDQELAVQAVKTFFDTGLRDSTLEWELDDKCWCRGTFDS